MPPTPARISAISAPAQASTTGPAWRRCSPWRRTKAFCAPMAMIRPAPANRPAVVAAIHIRKAQAAKGRAGCGHCRVKTI
ncbi:hypothetical protein G6F51_014647 [Rhizopus arrhizus]|uniref:Uncharacterized protein n=1 Tax=Rhizopus oryzae TaxID=64495 RepID=A0A9P7BYU7_RHIOR|nr:hypothetical protein G6F51_014647 [Rhizopus arrhizus]